MRAVVVHELGVEPEALAVGEWPAPEPAAGQVAIDVRAAGCNFADTLMLQGRYQVKPPLPFVLGAEAAGVVASVGAGVGGFSPGDRVLALTGQGAFAERVAVPAAAVHRIPDAMPFEHGAALPIIYPTSYAALVYRAALAAGETLLVHAAAGGVGTAAVQIGKALGARVIATAGGPEKLEVARRAGADVLIDYRSEDFVERVLGETDGRGADVIYDSVGGETCQRSLSCIAWNGRLLVIGFASGEIPSIAANRVMLKNVSVVGCHWPAYAEKEPERVPEAFAGLFELYERGAIRPFVDAVHPLEQVGRALADLAGRKTVGKVILTP